MTDANQPGGSRAVPVFGEASRPTVQRFAGLMRDAVVSYNMRLSLIAAERGDAEGAARLRERAIREQQGIQGDTDTGSINVAAGDSNSSLVYRAFRTVSRSSRNIFLMDSHRLDDDVNADAFVPASGPGLIRFQPGSGSETMAHEQTAHAALSLLLGAADDPAGHSDIYTRHTVGGITSNTDVGQYGSLTTADRISLHIAAVMEGRDAFAARFGYTIVDEDGNEVGVAAAVRYANEDRVDEFTYEDAINYRPESEGVSIPAE